MIYTLFTGQPVRRVYITVCEAFFKYLKKERTNRRTYHSFEDLKRDVFDYIEDFYNNRRPLIPPSGICPPTRRRLYFGIGRNEILLIPKTIKNVSKVLTIVHITY